MLQTTFSLFSLEKQISLKVLKKNYSEKKQNNKKKNITHDGVNQNGHSSVLHIKDESNNILFIN